MSELVVQLPDGNSQPAFQAAEASDFYLNNSRPFLVVRLPADRVLTVHSPYPDLSDFTRAYSAGEKVLPHFDALRWNGPGGVLTFSWDDPGGVVHAAVLNEVVSFSSGEELSGSLYR